MNRLLVLEHLTQAIIELTDGLPDDVCIDLDRALRNVSEAIQDKEASEDQLALDFKMQDKMGYGYDDDF